MIILSSVKPCIEKYCLFDTLILYTPSRQSSTQIVEGETGLPVTRTTKVSVHRNGGDLKKTQRNQGNLLKNEEVRVDVEQ